MDLPWMDEAWTFSIITGKTEPEVIQAFGASSGSYVGEWKPTESDPSEVDLGVRSYINIRRFGMFVLVAECNGWIGSDGDTAIRVTTPEGYFISSYWGGQGIDRMVEAKDGELLADFEPLLWEGGNVIPSWIADAGFEERNWGGLRFLMLDRIEKHTGFVIDRQWLEAPWATYRATHR